MLLVVHRAVLQLLAGGCRGGPQGWALWVPAQGSGGGGVPYTAAGGGCLMRQRRVGGQVVVRGGGQQGRAGWGG